MDPFAERREPRLSSFAPPPNTHSDHDQRHDDGVEEADVRAREGSPTWVYQFDLPALGLHRLRAAGVGFAEWTRHCTYADPDRFYSYRRTTHNKEADYGRLIAAITLGPAD